MAIKTNKSDVINNYVRYYGRQPNQEELKPGGLIDNLTTKAPSEVESLLAKTSPITKGKLWAQYNQSGGAASGGETGDPRDKPYNDARDSNPRIKDLADKGGSTPAEIAAALLSGDLSGIVDWQGKPFSPEDQQKALSDADESTKAFYEQQQAKETADAESSLAQKQADYQDYLINSGQNFESDKTQSDQTAADSGILFSGGRVQKEQNLQRAYEQDQASKLASVSRSIGTTANDFQYKYGNDAASGLSKYYNLGGNTFNPNVAAGGVGQKSLSSVYNPGSNNYYGTRRKERALDNATRSAGYLWNKGNKLLATGYNNQY